jgi:LysM repeat protein
LIVLACLLAASWFSASAGGSFPLGAKTPKINPSGGSPYDLIALVNQVRAANGLAPFQINGALMAAAQAHSQYQASIGSASHTGSGGSTVKGRALAAGYGAGADVSVIENIYSGLGATPQNAVSWWQGDGIHLDTLLSTRHTEAGAGLAEAGGVVYMTLDVGSVLGGSAPPAGASNPAGTEVPGAASLSPSGSSNPAQAALNPMVVASPNPDGSLVHKVQLGQTLWTIAAAYQVPLPDLLQLNGFTENSYIFPGDEVLVKPANRQMETSTSEARPGLDAVNPAVSPGSQPTPTRASTSTPPPEIQKTPAGQIQPDQAPTRPASSAGLEIGWIFAVALLLGGAALITFGSLLNRGG